MHKICDLVNRYSWDRQKIIELIEKVEKDEITWTILNFIHSSKSLKVLLNIMSLRQWFLTKIFLLWEKY